MSTQPNSLQINVHADEILSLGEEETKSLWYDPLTQVDRMSLRAVHRALRAFMSSLAQRQKPPPL